MISVTTARARLQRSTYAEIDFEGVIDEPLERGQSTNHEDADRKSVPQTTEADLPVDPANSLTSALAGLAVVVQL